MGRDWMKWLKAALIRAVKTFAQTFVGCIAVGATAQEVDWLRALSVSGVAFVASVFTSLAGLPEEKIDRQEQEPEQKPPAEDNVD